MTAPLLLTKLNLPQPPANLVARPALLARLSEGLTARLTLVSAPPGFGKTTLIVEWLKKLDLPIAWLSLDAGDNDPLQFCTYFLAAIQNIAPDCGLALQASLAAGQLPPLESIIAVLINDLSKLDVDVILVLDDYYLIQNEQVHAAIRTWVEQQTRNIHLILLTREDPPLPLPRLRIQRALLELREVDLRFSFDETSAFLSQTMGLKLSEQAIKSLAGRTEGWVAGIQMAALAIQASLSLHEESDAELLVTAFSGDDRYVMDYLMDEVFRRQPVEIQDFLLKTSLLEKLSGPLCDELLGTDFPAAASRSQEILEQLERANLFLIPLDDKRQWFRYHHLFADLLRYRAGRQHPQQIPELHRRASGWFRTAGEPDQAMKHALASMDQNLVADVAEDFILRLVGESRIGPCLEWIAYLPAEMITSRAYLCAACAWVFTLSGQLAAAQSHVEAGTAALENYKPRYCLPDGRWIDQVEVRGHLLAIRAYLARLIGNPQDAIEFSNLALTDLPVVASTVRCVVAFNLGLLHVQNGDLDKARKACLEAVVAGRSEAKNLNVIISAFSVLSGIAAWQGELDECIDFCQQAIQLGSPTAHRKYSLPAIGYAYGQLAGVYSARNQLATAQSHLDRALELIQHLGVEENILYSWLFQVRLAIDRADLSQAETWLKRVEDKLAVHPLSSANRTAWIVNHARLSLIQDGALAALRWLSAQGVHPSDLVDGAPSTLSELHAFSLRLPEYLLLSRLLMAVGEVDQAAKLLDSLLVVAETSQNFEALLEGLVCKAMIPRRRVDEHQSIQILERALQLAAPQGYIRPFLNGGESLKHRLRQAIAAGIQSVFAGNLLAALAEGDRRQAANPAWPAPRERPPASIAILLEPLTPRETQILRLLAAGLTSSEIAAELVISVSTTRGYIKSIYTKLAVHSRKEAIDQASQAGLI